MNKGGPGARKPKPGPRGERILILPMMSLLRGTVAALCQECSKPSFRALDQGIEMLLDVTSGEVVTVCLHLSV